MSAGISATTIAAVGAAAAVAGAGAGAYSSIQAGNAASSSAKYNEQVSQQNAQLAQQNAVQASQAGEAQVAASQQKTRAQVGAIKAGEAASNVDVNSGSAVDVRSSAADLGELDAITVRSNAAKQAYGYETQNTSYEDQANLEAAQSENSSTAGEIGAGSTLIGGLGSASSNYARFMTQSSSMTAGGG